jgi:hypothetical protein
VTCERLGFYGTTLSDRQHGQSMGVSVEDKQRSARATASSFRDVEAGGGPMTRLAVPNARAARSRGGDRVRRAAPGPRGGREAPAPGGRVGRFPGQGPGRDYGGGVSFWPEAGLEPNG